MIPLATELLATLQAEASRRPGTKFSASCVFGSAASRAGSKRAGFQQLMHVTASKDWNGRFTFSTEHWTWSRQQKRWRRSRSRPLFVCTAAPPARPQPVAIRTLNSKYLLPSWQQMHT